MAKTLKELRKKNTPYNQKEMAEKLGVGESVYSYYESGRRRPSLEVLDGMSYILGVEPQVLLNIFLPRKLADRQVNRAQ